MATINELKELLLSTLDRRFAGFGFQRARRDQTWIKTVDWGKYAFHVSIIRHKADFDVTVDFALRFDDVESLIYNAIQDATKRSKDTFTLGVELGNLTEGFQKRWHVETEKDAAVAADEIGNALITVGLPYLNLLSDRREALDLLARDDQAARVQSPVNHSRANRAVALAWLSGDKHRAAELIEQKRQFLTSVNDFGLPSFVEFVNSLGSLVSERPLER